MKQLSLSGMRMLAATLAVLGAAMARSADIPSGPDVRTMAQLNERELSFDLKTSVDAYKACGMKGPKWDAAAIDFIEACERAVFRDTDPAEFTDLERRGRALYLLGCDDPLVLYECAKVADKLGNVEEVEHFARPAAERMSQVGYPANRQAFAAWRAYRACKALGHDDDAKKYAELLVKGMQAIFRDGVYGKDRGQLVEAVHELSTGMPGRLLQSLWSGVKDIPGADPVAVGFLEGEFHVTAAWEQRGGGWANTVAPAGWQGFEAELASARTCLTKAWELDKTVPEPAARMISVAMGSNPGDLRTWFDRAVAAQVDNTEAYNAYIYARYPRWHGNRESLLSFGDECFATRRFDTRVPIHFVYALFTVRDECDRGDTSEWSKPAIYDKVRETFEKSLAPGGGLAGSDFYRSMEAAFDVRANSWGDARKAIAQLKHGLDPKGTAFLHLKPDEVAAATEAYTGPGADDAIAGFVLAARGERAQAIKSYQAAIDREKDAAAVRYLRSVSRTLQWESDFYAFKEVKLNADSDLAGFRPAFGKWAADTDGGLIAIGQKEQQIYLFCNADFGNNWELHADIDFLRTDADWSLTGLTLCPSDSNLYLSMGLCPRQHKFIAHIANMDELENHAATIVWRNHNSTLRRDGDKVTFKLGDTEVYQGVCDDTETNRLRIGFGGWPMPGNDAVRFRNVSIKRTR